MGRLERLREAVADRGIIPRREGASGLPSAVYYLRVVELAHLLEHPEDAPEYIERAQHRSRKRRRKKYVKEKSIRDLQPEGPPAGHGARVEALLAGTSVRCLGSFRHLDRFVSETGYARAKAGYVYEVSRDGVIARIALSASEARHAWITLGVRIHHSRYPGNDLETILWRGQDMVNRSLLEDS